MVYLSILTNLPTDTKYPSSMLTNLSICKKKTNVGILDMVYATRSSIRGISSFGFNRFSQYYRFGESEMGMLWGGICVRFGWP